MRGRVRGAFRLAAREAARRAGWIGGVDAADLVLRAGRTALRVLLALDEEARWPATGELSSSRADSALVPGCAESTEV